MLRPVVLALLVGTLVPNPLVAQWRIGLDLGVEQVGRFARSITDPEGEGPDGRPTQGWPLALRVERGGDGLRAALSVQRLSAGLELFGSDLTVALRPGFKVLTVTPELNRRLLRMHGDGQLRLSLAAPVERWSFPTYADPPQWRVGLAAGLTAEWPIAARLTARVGAALGTVLSHPLADTEVNEEYDLDRVWRRAIRLGVAWAME